MLGPWPIFGRLPNILGVWPENWDFAQYFRSLTNILGPAPASVRQGGYGSQSDVSLIRHIRTNPTI